MAKMALSLALLALCACALTATAEPGNDPPYYSPPPPGPPQPGPDLQGPPPGFTYPPDGQGPPPGFTYPPQPGPPTGGPPVPPLPPVPADWTASASKARGVKSNAKAKLELFALPDSSNYTFYGTLTLQNITGFTMAHIHLSNGSVALWLFPQGAPSGPTPQPISGTFTLPFEVDAKDLQYIDTTESSAGYAFANLLNTDKYIYLNVHTKAYPAGELRGYFKKTNPFGQGRKMLM